MPAVMNAANEVAVEAFLQERIKFPDIWRFVEKVMEKHETSLHPSLEVIIEADAWARRECESLR